MIIYIKQWLKNGYPYSELDKFSKNTNSRLKIWCRNVFETAANLCRTLTCISFWRAKEKKYTFKTLKFLWENNNRQYVYLRWSYTAQRKSNHTKGFSWLLRRVQPIFPKPCQDLWFRCILFSPPLSFMKNDQIKHGSVFHQSVGG